MIGNLFGRLSEESNHGHMQVSRALGYLCAARRGFSEDELLDVLSQDEEVFGDFTQRARHDPPSSASP